MAIIPPLLATGIASPLGLMRSSNTPFPAQQGNDREEIFLRVNNSFYSDTKTS
jgi:hypothetical protein